MPYKGRKMSKKHPFLKTISNVTHFSKSNFQGLFKNVVFRSVVLVTKIHPDCQKFVNIQIIRQI